MTKDQDDSDDKPHSRKSRRLAYEKSISNDSSITYRIQEPRYSLDQDVVLPKSAAIQIEEAMIKIHYHKTIYEDWGFALADPNGKGVILNFYGKPGTGKTMTAEALAGTLGMPFLAIGIAELESKFMGDTAKNIQNAFLTAREHDAILFFDEADTLLGRRLSSVTQGVDNEVNASRSTMLTEIEKHEGILIFASNFAENYDKAFESRISHHIHFDLPDIDGRKALWGKNIVQCIPLSEDREDLISKVADESEGFSGRDIRTCMRIALPKPLIESKRTGNEPRLSHKHIREAIDQVRKAHESIGQIVNPMSSSERQAVRRMMNIN